MYLINHVQKSTIKQFTQVPLTKDNKKADISNQAYDNLSMYEEINVNMAEVQVQN